MLQLKMKCSWFLLLVFYVTFICCFICSEARWHSHTKHKHIHHHKVSSIAEPPTRPPEPADLFPETPISPVVVSPTSSPKHYNPSPEPPTSAAVTPPTSPSADLFPESPTSSVVVSPTSSPKHSNPSPEPPSSAAVTSPTSPSADPSPETPTSPVVVSPTSSPKHSVLSPEAPTSAAVISPTSPPKPSDPTREPPTSPVVPSPTGPPEPSDPYGTAYNATGIFNVLKFGAVGNGATDDTDAFKMAWDAACQVVSAVILVPKDHKFMIQSTIFTGPCQGSLVFQVDGTLMPPDGPDSWPQKNSRRQWLVFYRINGMSLLGGGVIDGRGQKWWDLPCKPHKGANKTSGPCDSPTAIRFFMSSNLTVQGLRIKDSPQFNFRFDGCRNVHIESLHITAPTLSPNTDGIHIENTNDVRIYNSVVSNGDDCVSIGAGCYDVGIKNVTCGPSHGISIGSLGKSNSRACVSNITVRDSTIKISDNGVRIKTWQGGSGVVSGITFNNIHMDNVRNPIIIDQFYCLSKDCLNQTSAVHVSDILYENIKGTYDVRSPPMHFGCSDNVPCTNLTLADIELLPANGEIILDPFCWNAYGESQTLTIPPVACLEEGSPGEILDDDRDRC